MKRRTPEVVGVVEASGAPQFWQVRCPVCGLDLDIDRNQAYGRAPIDCPECPYVDTVRIFREEP